MKRKTCYQQISIEYANERNHLNTFYQILGELKEEFHRTGRFDDANTKLDEISKLIVMKLYEEKRKLSGKPCRFSVDQLKNISKKQFGNSKQIAKALHWLFEKIIEQEEYRNPDGTSIFGSNHGLNIQKTENKFAEHIVNILNSMSLFNSDNASSQNQLESQFDILNEAFSHFIHSSFRSTKEDAQYMTPEEVVSAMLELALFDIINEPENLKCILNSSTKEPFVILDPTCGVGSFLVAALRQVFKLIDKEVKEKSKNERLKRVFKKSCLYGQDKVDRMVRLATLNLLFLGIDRPSIQQGNSIVGPSLLDSLEGKVDLILTNPPFGARFSLDEVLSGNNKKHYPMTYKLFSNNGQRGNKTINSEVLLLDRCLQTLKPGGKLLIVLPDNIASGKSKYKQIRKWIQSNSIIRAVIELPPVTFAQAGTRTKTIILYIQKLSNKKKLKNNSIFMGVCENIGYEVLERAGSPVKKSKGENQLIKILNLYKNKNRKSQSNGKYFSIFNSSPCAVQIREDSMLNSRWTPSFYKPRRLEAIKKIYKLPPDLFKGKTLGKVAEFVTKQRKTIPVSDAVKCISVLHVKEDSTIDMRGVVRYKPKWPGLECREGDVLFSKINPRIQRICVVPPYSYKLTCSSEFEIIQPNKKVFRSAYLLAALLRLPLVYDQVVCLTTGTSSSHNRIKDSDLREVVLPIPKRMYKNKCSIENIENILKIAIRMRYETDELLKIIEKVLEDVLNNQKNFSKILKFINESIKKSGISKETAKAFKDYLNKNPNLRVKS